jgi:hypothetical protein
MTRSTTLVGMVFRSAVLGCVVVAVMSASVFAQPGAPLSPTGAAPVPPPTDAPPPTEAPSPDAQPSTDAPPSPDAQPSTNAPPLTVAPAREPTMVERLTMGARSVARDGRCDSIAIIGKRVRELDPTYYQTVFVVDATIASCRPGVRVVPPGTGPVLAPEVAPMTQPVSMFEAPVEIVEVKSENTALMLSLGVTLGGIGLSWFGAEHNVDGLATFGSVAAFVGPTTGHIYADNIWNTGLQWRLGSLGVGVGAIVYAVSQCGLFENSCSDAAASRTDAALVVFVSAMISYGAATIYEIATAPSSARKYNLEYSKRRAMQIVPVSSGAPGLSLVGTF